MKTYLVRFFAASFTLLMISTLIFAQKDSQTIRSAAGSLYVISAKAGGVNYVQGDVSLLKADSTSKRLIKGDKVEVGEKVSTENNSKAEILLNPGSYARLGANAEFEFITTSLDDLKLKLNRGSAIFEVYASNDFRVSITAARAKFYVIKSGVYRVDILDNGNAKLEVWKGKAQVGDINATQIKKKRSVMMNGSQVSVSKFTKDAERDAFDEWSQNRARELAKANARLQRRTLRNSLYRSFNRSRWDFNTFGLWAFDARFGGYCFLPFSYGWRSPYGYGFRRNFFSSRPSNTFYYAVQRRTIRSTVNTGTVNRGGNNNAGRSNRGTVNRRTVRRGETRTDGARTNPRRVFPRNTSPRRAMPQRRVSPTRQRVRPVERPVRTPRRSTMRSSRMRSPRDN